MEYTMTEQGPYSYQKSWTVEKPRPESHNWSYQRACESAQSDIESRWGVDYRVTQIRFEDNGRKTKTENKPGGPRRWRCTHTVTCIYSVARRGSFQDLTGVEQIIEELRIIHVVLNEFHPNFIESSEHEEIRETDE